MTGFEKTWLPRTIINIWKYQFKSFEVLQLGKGNRYLHEICHDSIAIYNLPIHQLLSEQLAELPTILDSFAGTANTTSPPTE